MITFMRSLFVLMVALPKVCLGQVLPSHVSVQPEAQFGQAPTAVNDLETMLSKIDASKLRPVVPHTPEEEVLASAKTAANLTLRLNLDGMNEAGLYSMSMAEGDTLVALWRGNSNGGPQAVWLWDSPSYTAFVIEITPETLSVKYFPSYCESLLVWDRDPIHLTELKLAYLHSQGGAEQVIGQGKYIQTESGSYHMWFAAVGNETVAHIGVGMSKAMFSYPPEFTQVRERFPPLQLRLTRLPRHELFGELGKGYLASRIITYPQNRDAIIIAELLSRGPVSDVEVKQIIVGDFEKGDYADGLVINSRLIAFLRAVEGRKELPAYAAALERIFRMTTIHKAVGDAVIGHVFGAMEVEKVDFSRAALGFLGRNQYIRPSLSYLEMSTRDGDTLDRLSAIPISPQFENEKKRAIENIKRRLGSASGATQK